MHLLAEALPKLFFANARGIAWACGDSSSPFFYQPDYPLPLPARCLFGGLTFGTHVDLTTITGGGPYKGEEEAFTLPVM